MSDGNASRLSMELATFFTFKERLRSHPRFQDPDRYGFCLTASAENPDLLVTALTHGNEVIGLEILNLLLASSMLHNSFFEYGIGFLLNNVEAFRQKRRLLESDLNRGFLSHKRETLEQKRALEIENVITRLRPKLILDLHQTSEASRGPFALVAEDPEIILLAQSLTPGFPVITFPQEGFSAEGRTLTEFARELRIPAIVYEIGEKGFNPELAVRFRDILLNLQPGELLKNMKKTGENRQNTGYFHIRHRVPNTRGLKLMPGLQNLQPAHKGQLLATGDQGAAYVCPEDSLVIFPRYRNIRKEEPDLALLAVERRGIGRG